MDQELSSGESAHALSASAAAALLAKGELTSEALVAACLERIEARDPVVGAREFLGPAQALSVARRLDAEPRRSPIHGLPVGVKDVMDTADMPTSCGCAAYRGHRPAWDAACVVQLRAAGGGGARQDGDLGVRGVLPRQDQESP